MTILYLGVLMVLTPLVLELFNKRVMLNGVIANKINGLPAFTVNLFICVVFGFLVCILPLSSGFNFTNWVVYTALIFLGNQVMFNLFIKTLAKYRQKE